MKKLNKKGYLTIEIILGATIAFVIAFFLIEITTKMVSDTEDTYRDTVVTTDGALITSGIKDAIESHETGIKKIEKNSYYEKYTITYEDGNQGVIELSYDYSKKRYTVSYYEGSIVYYKKELDSSLSRCYIVIEVYDTNGRVTDLSDLVDKNIYIGVSGGNIFTDKWYSFIIPIDNLKKDDVCNIPSVGGSVRLVDYIGNLYSRGDKKVVTNNGVEYNTVECLGLINDRKGGTTTDYDDGNIRYYGENPNNYIYFNCDDYSNQTDTTCEKWRIIGVFDTETPKGDGTYKIEKKAKIIRGQSIGEYSWDTSPREINSGWGINQWGESGSYEGADLMRLLNPGYESSSINSSLYWNRKKGTCYKSYYNATDNCDFTNTGLKEYTRNTFVSKTKWNTGGNDDLHVYANDMYKFERGTNIIVSPSDGVTRTTSWDGYVALPYPSDIIYTANFDICKGNMSEIFQTENKECPRTSSWLANTFYSQENKAAADINYYYWTLTPDSKLSWHVDTLTYNGSWGAGQAAHGFYSETNKDGGDDWATGALVSLYLDAWTGIYDGNGSSDNPYKISFELIPQ